jgi:MerR family transcriptional regulator, copper efflux regulator
MGMTRPSRPETSEGLPLHQIGEVADLIGLSLRTIRHYEEVGVVVPSGRSPGGFRLYTERDIDRLRKVMGMKPMGFALEEIRDVLDLIDALEVEPVPDAVRERLQMYAALAVERRDKYRRKLQLATQFTADLQTIVADASKPASPSA